MLPNGPYQADDRLFFKIFHIIVIISFGILLKKKCWLKNISRQMLQ